MLSAGTCTLHFRMSNAIRSFRLIGVAYFYLLGDCLHALDALDGAFGSNFLGIACDVPTKRDDAVFDRHANIGRVNAWFEIECVNDELTQSLVAHYRLLRSRLQRAHHV